MWQRDSFFKFWWPYINFTLFYSAQAAKSLQRNTALVLKMHSAQKVINKLYLHSLWWQLLLIIITNISFINALRHNASCLLTVVDSLVWFCQYKQNSTFSMWGHILVDIRFKWESLLYMQNFWTRKPWSNF